MLRSLHIENVALIKCLDIDFEEGFNVLTGETGAGKSILLDSINIICGARISKDIIRSGENECFVSAIFDGFDFQTLNNLEQLGIKPDDDDSSLMISRRFTSDGKSTSKIGTRTVPASLLKTVTGYLITISGQHDSFNLLNPDMHIFFLDKFASSVNENFQKVLEDYANTYNFYKKKKNELDSAYIDENLRKSKLDFLHYQFKEIESAKIKPGEESQLLSEKNILKNSEILTKVIKGTSMLLMGTSKPGAYDKLVMSSENVEKISDVIPEGPYIIQTLQDLSDRIQEINETLLKYLPKNIENPSLMLDKIESRLDLISKIKDKYGETEEEVLKTFEELEKQISFYEQYEFSVKELRKELEEAYVKAKEKADLLMQFRNESALILQEKINSEFTFLDMDKVCFEVKFIPKSDLDKDGTHSVEFFVRTNPGEMPKNLSVIASGGELSRIMLALMKILAKSDKIGTVVFDEIDTGVSGKTSSKIGISIKSLSAESQVICVTHSAQVSAVAHHHYKLSKTEKDGRMFTTVKQLNFDERVDEISRILGGVTVTEHAIETAKEMIVQGNNI